MNLSSHFERLIECINEFNLSASRIFGVLVEEEFHKESFGTMSVKKLMVILFLIKYPFLMMMNKAY